MEIRDMVEGSVPTMMDKQERDALLAAWTRMVNCVAHDVTTPLASIRLENSGLKKLLPKLLQGYQLAVQHKLIQPLIPPSYMDILDTSSVDIENHLNKIVDFLSLLRHYNQKLSVNENDPQVHLKACLPALLENYPFVDEQKSLIHLEEGEDFQFKGESFFIEYLFFNLIENALSHIQQMGQGEIYISTKKEKHYFVLHFKDTAGALDEKAATTVFDWFFIKRDGEVVPGLGFCRLKLLHMGGDIICEAVKNQYTEFSVKFPNVLKP